MQNLKLKYEVFKLTYLEGCFWKNFGNFALVAAFSQAFWTLILKSANDKFGGLRAIYFSSLPLASGRLLIAGFQFVNVNSQLSSLKEIKGIF